MTTTGVVGGAQAKPRDFPPRWVAKLLKSLFVCVQCTVLAAAGYAAQKLGAQLVELHKAGSLLPYVSRQLEQPITLPAAYIAAAVAAVVAVLMWQRRKQPIYLLDFECYRPEDCNKVSYNRFVKGSRDSGFFDDESMEFQTRILHKSALSEETFFPPGLHLDPPEFDMKRGREEVELTMYNSVADLLKKTGLKPRQIDVLVTNCSLFNPTPSMSAMIINHFKMRSDIDSYNLAGMGCSAGVIAIGLAKKLLAERGRGGYALVVSTESITQNWYHGTERSMLIPNTIFRMGAAAILLTNKPSERYRSKYSLEHVVRVHLGADDMAYNCIFQKPDPSGTIGVELSKDLVKVAGKAMTMNMTKMGPLVLPWSEKLMFAANWVARKVLRLRVPAYIPDFREAFDHFCLHAGGRGVVEGLSKQLSLSPTQMAPSANTLHWYGNTSSSTVWYSLGFIESVQGVRKGDIVWQIGFGSGFKCNSAVWKALRNVNTVHHAWEHIKGREGQALEVLQRIGAETAAERLQQEQGKAANGVSTQVAAGEPEPKGAPASNGYHHSQDDVAPDAAVLLQADTAPAPKLAGKQQQPREEADAALQAQEAAPLRGRALRSGKVVAYAS